MESVLIAAGAENARKTLADLIRPIGAQIVHTARSGREAERRGAPGEHSPRAPWRLQRGAKRERRPARMRGNTLGRPPRVRRPPHRLRPRRRRAARRESGGARRA